MKYLQKFNESIILNNINQSDFDLIEDIFLFWSDRRPIRYVQNTNLGSLHPAGGLSYVSDLIKNSTLVGACQMIVIDFTYDDLFATTHLYQDFAKVFGADPSQFFASDRKQSGAFKVFQIESVNNLYERNGPFPNNPKTNIQKFIHLLDVKFNVKQDLIDILDRTRGLEYYGFKWEMYINCNFEKLPYSDTIMTNFCVKLRITK